MKALLSIAAIAASVLSAAPASATLLVFDDIGSVNQDAIADGYGGLNWDNFYTVHRSTYPGSGYDHGTVSGEYVAYNGYADPATITAVSGTFSFNSAWFTSAWAESLAILIEGFQNGDDVADYSVTLTANNTAPLFFEAGWTDLTSVRFTSVNAISHFAMDDLRINEAATVDVPEPLTISLLGMGLLGVAGARRRKA